MKPPAPRTPGTPFTSKVVLVKWHDAVPECGSITRGDNLAAARAIGFIFGSDAETFSAGINGDDAIPGVLMAKSRADAIRDALDNSLAVSVDGNGTEVNAVTRSSLMTTTRSRASPRVEFTRPATSSRT